MGDQKTLRLIGGELAHDSQDLNGLYKTELIRRQLPWRTIDQLELATAARVDFWNTRVASTAPAVTFRRPSSRRPTFSA